MKRFINNRPHLASEAPDQLANASRLTINTLSCYRRCWGKSLQIKTLAAKCAKRLTCRCISVTMCKEPRLCFKRKISGFGKTLLKVSVRTFRLVFNFFRLIRVLFGHQHFKYQSCELCTDVLILGILGE